MLRKDFLPQVCPVWRQVKTFHSAVDEVCLPTVGLHSTVCNILYRTSNFILNQAADDPASPALQQSQFGLRRFIFHDLKLLNFTTKFKTLTLVQLLFSFHQVFIHLRALLNILFKSILWRVAWCLPLLHNLVFMIGIILLWNSFASSVLLSLDLFTFMYFTLRRGVMKSERCLTFTAAGGLDELITFRAAARLVV